MNKTCLTFILITGLTMPSLCYSASDSPFLPPEEAIKLATTPRNKIHHTIQNATKAEIVGLNKIMNRVDTIQRKMLGQDAPNISAEIMDSQDTPEAVEAKINAVLGNNIQPEDLIHLMELPVLEEENSKQENPQKEILPSSPTPIDTTTTTGSTKEIIIEEEDDSTKHIYRRKVFTKQ